MIKAKKRELTKQELDDLLKDWFVRDSETFIKATSLNRLEWEKTLGEGAAYSEYILQSPTDKQLFKEGYRLAKDTLKAMMLPWPVGLVIGGQTSATTGKKIVVSTSVFDDKELSPGEKLDVFLGFTVHEGLHVKHTDFDVTSGVSDRVLFYLCNIIEDERIEELNGEEFPGFSRFLEKTKKWAFDKEFKSEKLNWDTMEAGAKILTIFLRLIRYPTLLREEDIKMLGDYLIRIKKVLFPYPSTTKEALEASEKVYAIIKELLAENKKEEKDKSEKGKGSSESGSDSIEITDADLEEIAKELKAPEKGSDLEKVMEIMASAGTPKEDTAKERSEGTASFIKKDNALIKELEHVVERPEGKKLYIERQPDNRENYDRALEDVKQYIPAIRKHLIGHSRDYKLVHKSMRSGVLDTTKLAEAKQYVQTIYMREGLVKTEKVNLVLLLDESGSMRGDKDEQAKRAAILIKEALKGIPNVNLFIYGHSSDIHGSCVTDLYVYYEPGYTPKYALGSVRGRSENRDGEAIMYAAERVRKFSQEKTLMFVMSDGYPAYVEYNLQGSIKATRDAVLFVQKRGWRVVQIAIDSFDPKTMFDHFLILDDISSLAKDLGTVVKKAVEKFSTIKMS